MEVDLNESSRVSAPRIFEFTIAGTTPSLAYFSQHSGQFLMANGRMRVSGLFRSGLTNEKSRVLALD